LPVAEAYAKALPKANILFRQRSWPQSALALEAKISSFPPQAYIIGAQKAATTSLASMLSQHPQIALSEPKEPDFFTNNWGRGLDWYRGCFARHDAMLLEASTSYTMAQIANPATLASDDARTIDVPRRIHELRPDAKFIYVVRDPAARTFSAYWHDVREGRESRPLRRRIAENPGYLDPSFYYGQIARYLAYFPADCILILRFEEFTRDPLSHVQRCAEFLGLSPFTFGSEPTRNESFRYNRLGSFVRDAMGKVLLKKMSLALRSALPERSHRALKGLISRPIPRLSSDDRAWLNSFFEKDMAALEKLMEKHALGSAARPVTVSSLSLLPDAALRDSAIS
jgi:hypothetical protein